MELNIRMRWNEVDLDTEDRAIISVDFEWTPNLAQGELLEKPYGKLFSNMLRNILDEFHEDEWTVNSETWNENGEKGIAGRQRLHERNPARLLISLPFTEDMEIDPDGWAQLKQAIATEKRRFKAEGARLWHESQAGDYGPTMQSSAPIDSDPLETAGTSPIVDLAIHLPGA